MTTMQCSQFGCQWSQTNRTALNNIFHGVSSRKLALASLVYLLTYLYCICVYICLFIYYTSRFKVILAIPGDPVCK